MNNDLSEPVPQKLSISALAVDTGATRENVIRWLKKGNLYHNGEFLGPWQLCVEEIEKHRKGNKVINPKAIDPKTGLPWPLAEKREKTLEQRRLNRIADKLEKQTYMPSEVHFERLSLLCGKLENLPGKAKSELGLSEPQRIKLQAMVDEIRSDTAKEISSAKCSKDTNPPSSEQ